MHYAKLERDKSHKVAQSKSIFIDKYRILNKISADSACKVHFEIYIYC